MRIEHRKVITVELSREEAICFRRVLDHAKVYSGLDAEAERVAEELETGLGQHLYETPAWAGGKA